MKWISATDLEGWSRSISARAELPALIADLIRASAKEMSSFRFPSGDKGQVRGFDGHLEAEGVGPYVPDGRSIWEFGVGDGVAKAEEDYRKRVSELGAEDRAKTTFVFVTLQTWNNPKAKLEDWVIKKRAEGDWKDVRYIDGVQLEHWLDEHPAVAAQYARAVLGVYPSHGVLSTDEFWADYSNSFCPPLTEEVLLCEREEQAKSFVVWLDNEAGQQIICGDAIDEVIAFAVAAVRKADPARRFYLESRILIVDSETAARFLRDNKTGLIFFLRGDAQKLAGSLAKVGPTLLATGADRSGVELLPRASIGALAKAIATMGIENERAYDLARRCGRSIIVLRRILCGSAAPNPAWISDGRLLLPAFLLGAWDSQSEPDRDAVRALAGKEYFDYEGEIRKFKRTQDSPLDQEQNIWKVRAPVDAFIHIGHLIGNDDLARLKVTATAIFSQAEPLPDPNEPFRLEPRQSTRHSSWMRDGVATTLLLIAALSDQANLGISKQEAQNFVDEIVRALPGLSTDHRMLASLGQQLPLLAEAAPSPLLLALEQMLEGNGEPIRPIFSEVTQFLSPSSPHTGLLWALEILAWDPAHLRRVALILAKLARIDPGGQLANRPINSLRAIFLSWAPCTNAPLPLQLAVLDAIATKEPEIGWKLLVELLPKFADTSFPTSQPRFRESGASEKEVLTYSVVWESQREIAMRALGLAQGSASRLVTIINKMGNFEPSLIARTLILVDNFLSKSAGEARLEVWAALQDEFHRHVAFAGADWALPSTELVQIEEVVERYKPSNPIESEAWLFDDWSPDLPNKINRKDGTIHVDNDVIDVARHEAVRKVLDFGGIDAVLDFAERVQLPQFVASVVVDVTNDPTFPEALINRALGRNSKLDHFASLVSSFAAVHYRDTWIARFKDLASTQGWSSETIAMLLRLWPDNRNTWELAAQFGPETETRYWNRVGLWLVQGDKSDVIYAAHQYLKVGRPVAALNTTYNRIGDVPTELAFELLDSAIGELNANSSTPDNMFGYHVEQIFKDLAARDDVAKIDLARREYAYLPLLDRRDRSLTLHHLMAEEPAFFVSVICDVYKASAAEREEPTQEQRNRARLGFQLLKSFRVIPGTKDGVVDAAALHAWVSEVLRLGAEQDRKVISEQYVGQVLAHAPTDPEDAAWPLSCVRDILEELENDQVERGLFIERLNMRGAHWKKMYEGGKQERELATKYHSWAKSSLHWPRTSALLGRIATHWTADAGAEDVRARQDKMRD